MSELELVKLEIEYLWRELSVQLISLGETNLEDLLSFVEFPQLINPFGMEDVVF